MVYAIVHRIVDGDSFRTPYMENMKVDRDNGISRDCALTTSS